MSGLTHINAAGEAHMVDISEKSVSNRRALAAGLVRMSKATRSLVMEGRLPKGDTLAAARLAGIMAAKKTSDLIPLCHPLPLSKVALDFREVEDGIALEALVRTDGKTGVEMEALTAVSVAALTLYDMVKAVEKSAVITDIRLLEKDGGKSGPYRRDISQC